LLAVRPLDYRPIRIRARNFKPLGDVNLDFDALGPLTCVFGPNAIGKSFLAELEGFAIWKEVRGGNTIDSIPRISGDGRAFVSIEFEAAGARWVATRTVKVRAKKKGGFEASSDLVLQKFVNGQFEVANEGDQLENQKLLVSLAGTYDRYLATRSASQFDIDRILKKAERSPADFKDLVQRSLGIDLFDLRNEIGKAQAKALQADVDRMVAQVGALSDPSGVPIAELKAAFARVDGEKDQAQEALEKLEADLAAVQEDGQAAAQRQATLEADAANFAAAQRRKQEVSDDIAKRAADLRDIDDQRFQAAADVMANTVGDDAIAQAEGERIEAKKALDLAKSDSEQRAKLFSKLNQARIQLARNDQDLKTIDDQLAAAGAGAPDAEADLVKGIDDAIARQARARDELEALTQKRADGRDRRAEFAERRSGVMAAQEVTQAAIRALRAEFERLKTTADLLKSVGCAANPLPCPLIAQAQDAAGQLAAVLERSYDEDRKLQVLQIAAAQLTREIDDLAAKDEALAVQAGRPTDDHHRAMADRVGLEEKLTVVRQAAAAAQEWRDRRIFFLAQADNLKATIADLDASLTASPTVDLDGIAQRHEAATLKLDQLKARWAARDWAERKILALDRDRAAVEDGLSQLTAERDKLVREVEGRVDPQAMIDQGRADIARLRAEFLSIRDQERAKNDQLTSLSAESGRISARIEAQEANAAKVAGLTDAIAQAQATLAGVQVYLAATSRDGIPYLLLEKSIPRLRELCNYFLAGNRDQLAIDIEAQATTTKGRQVNDPAIFFNDAKGRHGLADLSGYQRMVVGSALRAALALIEVELTGSRISVFTQDEGFAASDKDNLLFYHTLLRRLADHFGRVIYISHQDELREGADTLIEGLGDPRNGTTFQVVSE